MDRFRVYVFSVVFLLAGVWVGGVAVELWRDAAGPQICLLPSVGSSFPVK